MVDALEKTPMLGKTEGRRRRGQQRVKWLDGIPDSMDMNLSKPREMVADGGAWRAVVRGVARSRTRLSHWTTATTVSLSLLHWQSANSALVGACLDHRSDFRWWCGLHAFAGGGASKIWAASGWLVTSLPRDRGPDT